MKNMLFLIAFLFSVVCFAAPPPDLVYDSPQWVQSDSPPANFVSVAIDVKEVTYNYIGNSFAYSFQPIFAEPVTELKLPIAIVINYDFNVQGLSRPPLLSEMQVFLNDYKRNKQHTNYGYPLTGDGCRS